MVKVTIVITSYHTDSAKMAALARKIHVKTLTKTFTANAGAKKKRPT